MEGHELGVGQLERGKYAVIDGVAQPLLLVVRMAGQGVVAATFGEVAEVLRLFQPGGEPVALVVSVGPAGARRLSDELALLLLHDALEAELRDAWMDRVGRSLGSHRREHHHQRREDVDGDAEWDERDDADGVERAWLGLGSGLELGSGLIGLGLGLGLDGEERARDDREQLAAEAGVFGEVELIPVQGDPSHEKAQ